MKNNILKKLVGYRIKELRINMLNKNQEEFSQMLGWDRTYLSKVESGRQNLTIDSLEHVCSILGVSFKEFFIFMDEDHIGGDEIL